MSTTEQSAALRRIARNCMSAWARRWRVVRNDPQERATAERCLAEAVRLREWSELL